MNKNFDKSTLIFILIFQFIYCDYNAIEIRRNIIEENVNSSSVLIEEFNSLSNEKEINDSSSEQNKKSPIFTTINLNNYKDVQYSGDIYVGTPYVRFSVIYDTGSNLFWLPSLNCTVRCRNNTNKYNPLLSSTSKNLHIKKNISYAKGYIKGRLFKEKVALNKQSKNLFLYNKELSVDDYKLIAAYKEKYLYKTIFDGIVGLGLNDEGDINNSLIKLLYNQNKISVPAFSFYLLNKSFKKDKNTTSRLYVGDILENDYINNLFKDNIKYCYISSKNDYWKCETQSIKFELKENNNTNKAQSINIKSYITFDTGTSYSIVPKNDSKYVIDYLNNTLGKKCIVTKFHQIFCECNSKKDFGDIKLYFDEDNYYQINFEDIIKYNKKFRYQCHFKMLVDRIDIGMWVIGDSSLMSNLITFNMQERKISFVQNINKIIDDNKIAKSSLINRSRINSSLFWIFIITGIILVIFAVIYFL